MTKALCVAAFLFSSSLLVYEPPPAEACGVKIQAGAHKIKRSQKSANPSNILVVGRKDSTLVKNLRSKQHTVHYATDVSEVKSDSYALVIADESQMDDARERFQGAQILKKDGSAKSTSKTAEVLLARKVKARSTARPTNTRIAREPTATGLERGAGAAAETDDREAKRTGIEAPRVSASGRATASPEPVKVEAEPRNTEPEPTAQPRRNETVKARRAETADKAETSEKVERGEKSKAPGKWTRTVLFGTNQTKLNAKTRRNLRANALWLEQNPDASVTVEGHTDSVGDAAYNMDLSERRANVAKDFLMSLGVDESRIQVVPRGEEDPAFEPSTNGKNRRVVLIKND